MDSPSAGPPADRRPPARAPLAARRRAERAEARRRIAARTSRDLTPAQRALDPMGHGRRTRAARLAIGLLVVLASTGVHGSVVGVGVLISGFDRGEKSKRERIQIEMRERAEKREEKKLEPKPEEQKPKATVEPQPVAIEKPAPRPAKVEPPPVEPPPAEPPRKGPPPRVVGISLEATTEGGEGPSFGVGETRAGVTADRAVAPGDLGKKPEATPGPAPKAQAGGGGRDPGPKNQVASRIPTAGVKYVLPKRKRPSAPAFPDRLKAQGIEADVPVMVSLDADGKVTDVKILKSSGYPEFDEAARAAAIAEEFEPATRDGVPVPYSLSFTYRFRLEDP